jgi:MFS family permease
MKRYWLNSVFPIAALFSFRMLGLFMLIPVFTVYAKDLSGANATLIGIALGSYGLSQGLLQMPFGLLSDKVGRKPVITAGLILFALGSLLGALTTSIYGMIIARILQGTGAIGSVLIALLADLTPDDQRTKSMAVIGSTIGLSFSLAMVISPAITHHFGLSSIFYFTAALALAGLFLLHAVIPTPKNEPFHLDSEVRPALLREVLGNSHLLRLNIGIFCQHVILTATFYAIPMILQQHMEQGQLTHQWHFYLPLMLFSFIGMIPFILISEKKKKLKGVFLSSIVVTLLSQLFLAYSSDNWIELCGLMFLYFVAFNILEATLPSLVSKQSNANSKGTAMGIYSSSQFLGIFIGGSLAGILFQLTNIKSIFLLNTLFAVIWLIASIHMKPNAYQTTLILKYSQSSLPPQQLIELLQALPGVNQAVLSQEEAVVYLRINKAVYRSGSAESALKPQQHS